ncbi:cysteine desulfurase NifS [Dehalogenimonas etheniformans]|uniref:Cysteine desulfurase IscS n=1 Tax=Dehalogenimonas etheniformans TaxID=1536648 RepID=A0A2P5P7D7_9CHLR|nr:cysteine desulfurase NifS [Dehalogenimonas etheniformans]PPD58189.1 cysteine desulfurase NifS [Dehalogenimonas etheniformans]QNT75598.1 cysteine desulfurase NifS [Dehalogenimonas etheniformans]
MKRSYLDYAATTPVAPEVLDAMLPYFHDFPGNPSAIYAEGQQARQAVETARVSLARLINARPDEILFLSGGTEADNMALSGILNANGCGGSHIVTTAIEHHAVLETCYSLEKKGTSVTILPVDSQGLLDPLEVARAIRPDTSVVSVILANNEIGTVQRLPEISRITREKGVYLHTDAVQAVGRVPVDVQALGVDLLSISAHKLYGPKGIGALYVRKGTRISPILWGGGQERGKRSGTENVPGIVGLGKAAELAAASITSEVERLSKLRDRLIAGLLATVPETRLNGHPTQRLPNNANFSFDYVEGESVCLNLDLAGISASPGSACSSTSTAPSHVLLALGLPQHQAFGSLRLSLGRWTTGEDIERVLEVLPGIVARLRAMSPIWTRK